MTKQTKILPHLWYTKDAEEAARFYTSTFPDSRIDNVVSMSGGPAPVTIVDFTLFGSPFTAMSAGPHDPFNGAISFVVRCDTQAELDRYWNAILEAGGRPQACGWICDRYGVRWQIVPAQLGDLLTDKDPARAARATAEMLTQVKIDIAKIQAAAAG